MVVGMSALRSGMRFVLFGALGRDVEELNALLIEMVELVVSVLTTDIHTDSHSSAVYAKPMRVSILPLVGALKVTNRRQSKWWRGLEDWSSMKHFNLGEIYSVLLVLSFAY